MSSSPIGPLILALAVAMAPLVFHLPLWAVAWCTLAWGYLLLRQRRGWPPVSKGMRRVVFGLGMLAVVLFAGLRFDGGDFIALLAVMAGLKPLEISGRRDCMVTVFLAYFLTITSLFVLENLSMTLYLFVSVWVTTGVLVHINDPAGPLRRQMRLSARLVVVAVPLMLMLFFLFPRLSGSFWAAPWASQSRSGFASTLRIGDVSRLALEDEPAFAVTFDDAVPPVSQLYWRGIVFKHFDGRTWQPDRTTRPRGGSLPGETLAAYTIVLEPHGYRHLFALDLPATVNPVATIMADHTLQTRRPVRQRFHYGASSLLDPGPMERVAPDAGYLALPQNSNPQAVALGRQWADAYPTAQRIVAAGLDHFRSNGFVYTLRPGRLGRDAIDDFLFGTRKGFCEHYAAAFAVLMRSAGVPARIVGGYQGGRWNELGGFFTVRQSDAHAWCEVWVAGRGWVRVDPTFVVSPDRIDAGLEEALSGDWLPDFLSGDSGWLKQLQASWEAVNMHWNMWFMGFSAEEQLALLARLGISLGRQANWLLVMVLPPFFIAAVAVGAWLYRRRRFAMASDDIQRTYLRFLKKMARIGLPKAPGLGPLAYARHVGVAHPAIRSQVDGITDLYVRLRYGREADPSRLKLLRNWVRRFRPAKISKSED